MAVGSHPGSTNTDTLSWRVTNPKRRQPGNETQQSTISLQNTDAQKRLEIAIEVLGNSRSC